MTEQTKTKEQTKEHTQEKTHRPTRLDISRLPRDNQRALGSLRQNLCASFNYCRQYANKLDVLDETLTAVLKQVRAEKKYQAEVQATAQAKLTQLTKQLSANTDAE